MFLNSEFAKRFEPRGDGYLFRERLGAPGYEISAAERDAFVEQFNRRMTWMNWILFGGGFVLLLGAAWLSVALAFTDPGPLIFAVMGLMFVGYMPAVFWLWGDPKRRLAARAAAVPGLDKASARREGLRKLDWSRLGLCVLFAVFLVFKAYGEDPSFGSGWSRAWLALAAALLIVAAVQAVRKWRIETRS